MNTKSLMSKSLGGLVLAALIGLTGFTAAAQTTSDTNADNSLVSTGISLLKDDAAFFGTNRVVTVDAGAFYSDHKIGGLVNVHTPLPIGTNGQVSLGLATAYIDHSFYSASLNLRYQKTVTIPYWQKPLALWAETGPGLNLHTASPIVQSFAGGTLGFDVYKGFWVYLSGFGGNMSDRHGAAVGGTVSGTIHY